MKDKPAITALAPWFGCDRLLAPAVGDCFRETENGGGNNAKRATPNGEI